MGLLFSAFLVLLTSRFGGFNTIQIVRYAQVVTVNCARLIYANQVATNGVVHVIDRVIKAVGSTIQDYLEVEEDLTTLSVSTHGGGMNTSRRKFLKLLLMQESCHVD